MIWVRRKGPHGDFHVNPNERFFYFGFYDTGEVKKTEMSSFNNPFMFFQEDGKKKGGGSSSSGSRRSDLCCDWSGRGWGVSTAAGAPQRSCNSPQWVRFPSCSTR